jgi:hypothetical protein
MNTQHTPGPWEAIYVGSGDWDLRGPITREDWKLAAAAPDLLDMLYTALPFIEDAADDATYNRDKVKVTLAKLKAVIAKATGEA